MTNRKVMVERAARAQLLATAGLSQADIAREMGGVTTRTIRRYLTYELPEEMQYQPSDLEVKSHEAFVQKAWPLILDLVDFVEAELKKGEIKAKDAIVAAGILIDKVRQLKPPAPIVTEAEQVTFVMRVNDSPARNLGDKEALPGEDAEGDTG